MGPLCVRASSIALLAISRNAVSCLLRVVFCEGSASSQSVLAAHFLGGVSDHSVFVPTRLHFWTISRNAVSHVEGCFFVAGTVMADVFSHAGPSFLKGLVFILEGLVDSRFAGGHRWDINLGFGLFCFLVGLQSHAPWLLRFCR